MPAQVKKSELKVIGAGFGRTGTTSLQRALEILNCGPCYHLNRVINGPDEDVHHRLSQWANVLENSDGEMAMNLLDGFHSCVDLPAAPMAIELFKLNPNAKVILGIRDSFDEWYNSASKTILKVASLDNENGKFYRRMQYKTFTSFSSLKNVPKTKEEFKISYEEWIDHIKKMIPEENMIIFKPNDGWEPICKLLGVPIPKVPYPSANDRKAFMADKDQWGNYAAAA